MDLLDELKKYLEDIESEQDDCVTQMELAKNDFQRGFTSGQHMLYRRVKWALEDILEREERKQCL